MIHERVCGLLQKSNISEALETHLKQLLFMYGWKSAYHIRRIMHCHPLSHLTFSRVETHEQNLKSQPNIETVTSKGTF